MLRALLLSWLWRVCSLLLAAARHALGLQRPTKPVSDLRVAIIGGGIAGVGAAWSLARAGCKSVHIFEKGAALGGNARVQAWPTTPPVTSGLSVLAWPDDYFHNYNELLRQLGIDTTMVDLRFFIRDRQHGDYEHGQLHELPARLQQDMARWGRMVALVRRVNTFFHGHPAAPSLYGMSPFNPFNVLSLRRLSRLFGVSAEFWNGIVVPIYSSSFLTAKLDCVPAVIAPVLHDLIPLDRPARMRTWRDNSSLVFARMAAGAHVHLKCPISRVSFPASSSAAPGTTATAAAAAAPMLVHTPDGQALPFDHVVFACSADAAAAALEGASVLERGVLGGVGYADDDDTSFLDGRIHMDAAVLPAEHRKHILRTCANYIEVDGGHVHNTFVLSSWVPAVRAAGVASPLLVTYNSTTPVDRVLGTVANRRCHPHMSLRNTLLAVLLLRLMQGRRGVFYCGSFATPGNGHDLSLLSGLVVAHVLGAPYPFADVPAAAADFARLRGLMGL